MKQDVTYRRRNGGPGDGSSRPSPGAICAITYLSRAQHLPPFYNAALSLTKEGCRVDGLGTARRIFNKPFEEVAPGFTFRRIGLSSRTFIYRLPGWITRNILVAALQYVLSFTEYNTKMVFAAWRSRADLVEAHDLPALPCAWLIARLRRLPLVYHAHELWPEMEAKVRFAGLWRLIEKLFIRGADLVIVPEPNRARIYLEEIGTRKPPMVIANCPPFMSAPGGTRLGDLIAARGKPASCVVLYQGLIATDRCIEEIVEATGFFDDGITLAMIGHGVGAWRDPQSRLPAGRSILHLPQVAYEELFEYTASAQIGLLFYRNTCRNNYYCAPNKLYEYMMMGLPVVTCNYPGLVEFVEGQEVGLCVDPEDPGAIAAAVNRIAGDEALRLRMRENCLRLAKSRWNWEREFPRLREAYAALSPGLFPLHAGAKTVAPPVV